MYSCRSLSVLLLLLFAGPVTAHAADRPAVMDVATVLARAEEGFRGAQLDAHYIYKLGLGVAADATLAQTWWDKAIAGWQPPADGPSAEEKFRLYLAVAEQGSGIAANQLAIVYREGRGTAADATQAAVWFERAARAGFASASGSYETLTGQPLPMGPIPQTPLPLEPLRALAEAGDARACYDLGLIYYNGQGVPKDTAVGQQWLNRAASAGWKWPEDPALKGDSPEANHGRWEYHAAQGSIYALHILAWNHYNGRNVAENKAEAANWFKRAADAGHLYSADKYAQMLRAGEAGVPYDPAAAVTYFERSAAGHYGSGYFGLAYAYATGSGATRDDRRARDFYERSLVVHPQLHASMINLGNLLKTGAGGPVDFPRARRLYEACLDVKGQTSGFAAINLGDMHRDGQLGSVDTVKAREFYLRAQAEGNTAAAARIAQLDGVPLAPAWPHWQLQDEPAETLAELKTSFDAHVAFSRALATAAKQPAGSERDAALAAVVEQHRALVGNYPEELKQVYYDAISAGLSDLFGVDTGFEDQNLDSQIAATSAWAEPYVQRAKRRLRAGRSDDARADADIARAINPDELKLAALYAELELPAEVLAVPQERYSEYNFSRVRLDAMFGKAYDEDAGELVALVFRNFGARLAAALAIADPDRRERALSQVLEIHRDDRDMKYPDDHYEDHRVKLVQALELQTQGKRADGLALIEEVAKAAPLANVFRLRGDFRRNAGELEAARADYQLALRLFPDYEEAKNALANLEQRLLRADPAKVVAEITRLFDEAKAAAGRRDAATAEARIRDLLKLDPEHLDGLLSLAELLAATNRIADAETTLRTARDKHVKDPRPIIGLATLRAARGEPREAHAMIVAALPNFPDSPEMATAELQTQLQEAMWYAQQRNDRAKAQQIFDATLPRLDALVEKYPAHAMAYMLRSQLRGTRGDAAGQLADLDRFSQHVQPPQLQVHLQLAQAYMQQRKFDDARRHLQAADKLGAPQAKGMLVQLERMAAQPAPTP